MSEQPTFAWYQNPTSWFIAIGAGVAALLFWFASGQPGAPLSDGDYSCVHVRAASQGTPTLNPPGATVSGGRVVDVSRNDLGVAASEVAGWSDLQKKGTDRFRLTITDGNGNSGLYECKLLGY